MAPLLLYSTNVFLKQHIQQEFCQDTHYVWCSESFDSKAESRYSSGYNVAPSSNPADIYEELKRAVEGKDKHCAKISAQRLTFINLAAKWELEGSISSADKLDIMYMVDNTAMTDWRPVLYIIPAANVIDRMELVPAEKRANPLGREYIIPDLKRSEFHIIELP